MRAPFEKHRAFVMNTKAEVRMPIQESAARDETRGAAPVRERVGTT